MSDSFEKNIYTREEFEEMRASCAKNMHEDPSLKKDAFEIMMRADKYNAFHQLDWMGEPVIQAAEDLLIIQDIIFKTKPDFIIECGTCWGGGLLFCASILKLVGGSGVIGVDIYIPEDLKDRLSDVSESYNLPISLISGSSVSVETIQEVRKRVGDGKCMIILDSDHSHDHVLRELSLYKEFVPVGGYMVCSDTMIDEIPNSLTNKDGQELTPRNRERQWGPGNNPRTALKEFITKESGFAVDEYYKNKLLMSCNPDGYLVRVK